MSTLIDGYFDGKVNTIELRRYFAASSSSKITAAVTPSTTAVLNPDADIFESKETGADVPPDWELLDPVREAPSPEGYVYMNGDVGKIPSGAVYPTTPETLAATNSTSNIASTGTDFSSMNGSSDSVEPYSVASPPPGALPASPSPGPIVGMPLDQLKQMLSSQLEYYFSRENLANDAYLLSQMDNDQYVPIWTVANFNQVKKLTKDIKLITDVLRESPNVQVDEEGIKVRPNHKRCIVILREISDNTPLEEVKGLFSGENCPKVVSCEFAHNNSWYVTFESDEDAQRAYRFLREEVREFQGKPIMARIKAKPMNRLPMTPVPAMGASAVPNVSVSTSSGANVAMKNGYRTPPSNMYEQNAYPSQQQRFLYANGASVPQNVSYGNQVQIYTFPPQQPFYPPNMIQPWGPTNPTYFDIGSVFSVNGLAPQGSFSKPPSARFSMPRRNRKSQPGSISDNVNMSRGPANMTQSYHRVSSPGASSGPPPSTPPAPKSLNSVAMATVTTTTTSAKLAASDNSHHNHSKSHVHLAGQSDASDPSHGSALRHSESDDNSYRQTRDAQAGKEPMPPRHRRRRKEDEVPIPGRPVPLMERKSLAAGDAPQNVVHNSSPVGRGPQFDLEATAFPPLPGLEGGNGGSSTSNIKSSSGTAPLEVTTVDSSNSQWENRLSDVVRGTAKAKISHSTKDKDGIGAGYNSPRASSPISPTPRKMAPLSVDVKSPSSQPQASQSPLPTPAPPPAAVAATTATTTTTTATLPSPAEKEAKEVSTNSIAASHSSVTLTPPSSPDKTVPLARNMADKSTKTDDNILNGDGSSVSSSRKAPDVGGVPKPKPSTVNSSTSTSKSVPTTTNAATMTSAVVVTDVTWSTTRAVATTTASASVAAAVTPSGAHGPEPVANVDGGPARLSYAQVAQHHKEKAERMLREKLSTDANQDKEKEGKKESSASRVTNQHNDFKEVGQRGDRDHRDGQGRGRGGPRSFDRSEGHGGFRRRDGPPTPRFREFIRPRSPK